MSSKRITHKVTALKNLLNHCGVVLSKLINLAEKMQTHVKSFIRSIIVNAIMWGLIFWFFFKFII